MTHAPPVAYAGRDAGVGPAGGARPGPGLVASLLLAGVLVGFTFAHSAQGFSVSDVGGRVATLAAMQRNGGFDPDLGYWAAPQDPRGRLQPFANAGEVDGRWVTAGTLPTLVLEEPLYRAGGVRAADLVPIGAAVAAALAGAALARRLGARDGGRLAFWLVGLGSPFVVYAVEPWDHAVGLAAIGWAVVLAIDAARETSGWWRFAAVGVLLGAAATVRTEAFIDAAVLGVVLAVVVWRRVRQAAPVVGRLAAVAGGAALPLAANALLERAVLGAPLRSTRTAGYAEAAARGYQLVDRLRVAGISTFGLFADVTAVAWVPGLIAAALLAAGLVLARSGRGRPAVLLAVTAAAVVGGRLLTGLGFVPGMLAATPVAIVGVVLGWRAGGLARVLVGAALVTLPLVFASQRPYGVVAIWGARYLLPAALVVVVVGAVALADVVPSMRVVVLGLTVVLTVFGGWWMVVRTHEVAREQAALARRPEPVLVSREPQLVAEGGAFTTTRRWLTAPNARTLALVPDVLARAGVGSFGLVRASPGAPRRLGPYCRTGIDRLPGLRGPVWVATFRRGACGSGS